jgi:hypothetical protein
LSTTYFYVVRSDDASVLSTACSTATNFDHVRAGRAHDQFFLGTSAKASCTITATAAGWQADDHRRRRELAGSRAARNAAVRR